jgi:hypothetical protein
MKLLKHFPGKFIKVLRIFNITKNLFLLKYIRKERNSEIINVPFDGHILIKTSSGYKVFNLKKKIVVTQYKSDLNKDIFNKIIRNLESIEEYSISPKIKSIDNRNKCFYEDYINLYKAESFYPISSIFYNKILPIWERNINIHPLRKINAVEYVTNQKNFISDKIKFLEIEGYDKESLVRILGYVEKLSTRILSDYKKTCIYLTLSHGDFHAWNVLLSRKDGILIDWETLKERSLYHDLYYMFLHNIFGNEKININELLTELDKCICLSRLKMQSEHKENALTINGVSKDLYRLLFFLEYIYLDFEKRIDTYSKRIQIEDRLKKNNECIKVFEEIELIINEKNSFTKDSSQSQSLNLKSI